MHTQSYILSHYQVNSPQPPFKNKYRLGSRGLAWSPRAVGSSFNPIDLFSPQFKMIRRVNPKLMSEGGPIIRINQKKNKKVTCLQWIPKTLR